MNTLTSLNRQRGTLKTKIGKITKFSLEFKLADQDPKEVEVTLKTKLTNLLEVKTSLQALIVCYTQLPDDTDLKDALDQCEELEDEIEDLEVKLNILLSKLECNTISEKETVPHKINYKIPDLPLPTFSGRYEEFQNFKTQFMSIIGNNKDLSSTQQLCYLKGCLKGEAKRLESAQDTYESLWSSLEDRYENKRAVIDCHIVNLLNLSKVQDSPNQLMHLIDNVKCR